MPKFEEKVPIETREPTVTVDGLPEGTHRFQLEVFNDRDRRSAPAFFDVRVSKAERPSR